MESTNEMIKKRAYELYLKSNGAHGNHKEDWLRAEKEILAELEAKKKTAAPVVPAKAKAIETKAAARVAKSPKINPVKKSR